MSNPVDDFVSTKNQQSSARREKEIGLWHDWHQSGKKPEQLEPLLKAYAPTINRKVRDWRPPAIPESAFRAELQGHLIKAFENYNPERAALSTHVEMRLQKAKRYVVKHQNLAYIPEGQVAHIGKIQKARDMLTEDLGRVPTLGEIASHLGVPVKRIETVSRAMKKDIPASAFESDPTAQHSSREHEVLDLLQYNLSPDEKQVFNHLYGREGKARMNSTNELAQRLGKSPSQISRLKTSILNKYNQYK